MAIMEISVVPIGTKSPSLSQYIAKAVKVLQKEKGVKHDTTAMGTIVEGEFEQLLSIAKKLHEAVFDSEVTRVVTTIKVDDRRDKISTISGKLESLKDKLIS